MIELYAITDDPAPPAPPLRAVRCDGLTVLCGPAERTEATADVLWRHEALVEGLMEDRDLLPVRFGTLVDDERAVARVIEERREELLASLDRVRGGVELAVRVLAPEQEPAGPAASGRDYMHAKARGVGAGARLHERLASLARDSAVLHGADALRAAYLVDREAVDDFIAAVGRLQAEHTDLAILCTGPWPPYSFVER